MSIETPESIAQRKGFEAGQKFGRAQCGHEAELVALRDALVEADKLEAWLRTLPKSNYYLTPERDGQRQDLIARYHAAREKVGK